MIKVPPHILVNILAALLLTTVYATFATAQDADLDHSTFTQLLEQHVDEQGMVDYQGLIENQEIFDRYLEQLDSTPASALEAAEAEQQIAFWINAYNAFTLKAVMDHYPIEPRPFGGWFAPDNSIKQIKGVWTDLEFPVAGQSLTLDHIEHQILRQDFDEPRVHFAIVCASLSCPDLRREAYTGAELEPQLADQQQRFLGDPDKGARIEGNTLLISKIFDWFPEDFQVTGQDIPDFSDRPDSLAGVLGYLYRHLESPEVRALLESGQFDVDYLDYDWRLNDQNADY